MLLHEKKVSSGQVLSTRAVKTRRAFMKNNSSTVIANKWLQITKIVVGRDTVTAQIPISLSAVEWTQVVMIADRNKMTIEEVIAYLVRHEAGLLDIVNNGFVIGKPVASRQAA